MTINALPDQLSDPSGNMASFTRILKTHTASRVRIRRVDDYE